MPSKRRLSTTPQLKEFSGTFYSEEIDATYAISLKDDKLVLRRKNVDGETPLGQFADAFSAAGTGGIRFTRDPQTASTGFADHRPRPKPPFCQNTSVTLLRPQHDDGD